VTAGYISGLDRKIANSDGSVMTLLQTDAAVNSGNSGGGLFNLDGELIGIVNAKYAQTGVEGLAFAIPIDWAYEVQLDLMEYGYVRGVVDHGITLVDVQNNRYYPDGVYVIESLYNTDLQNKDRIVSVNGVEVSTIAQLNTVCRRYKVGDTVEIVYSRENATYTTQLTLQEYVPEHIKDTQS
jgi:serine protease Do